MREGTYLVLVVDDDPVSRAAVRLMLADGGFAVLEAGDGAAALERVRAGHVDAVLLDHHMAPLTGLDVLAALRADPRTATLPVILLTADDDRETLVRAFEAGADDYLTKPVDPIELLARLGGHLRGHEAWTERLEQRLTDRARVVRSLERLSRAATAEAAAGLLCTEVATLAHVDAAVLVTLAGGGASVMASAGSRPGYLRPGAAIAATAARDLAARASQGPWVEVVAGGRSLLGTVPAAAAVAYAPVWFGDELAGVLVLEGGTSERASAGELLAAAVDIAALAGTAGGQVMWSTPERSRELEKLDYVLTNRAFFPVYQPVVDLATGAVVGFEALTRFTDGTPPEERFATARRLARRLALEHATLVAAVQGATVLPDDVWLSLNVSPSLVLDTTLLAEVLETSARPTVLELTEHEPIEDYAAVRRALTSLPPATALSVDDAGSGFASLRHVLALRPNYMKLDRSWVTGLHTDPARQALIAGLGQFTARTGARLVAEGVETDGELQALRSLHVALGQGFLLGRPEPARRHIASS